MPATIYKIIPLTTVKIPATIVLVKIIQVTIVKTTSNNNIVKIPARIVKLIPVKIVKLPAIVKCQ